MRFLVDVQLQPFDTRVVTRSLSLSKHPKDNSQRSEFSMNPLESRGTRDDYLFPMVKTLIVIFQRGHTFLCTRHIIGVCVNDVAGKELLPEWKAA